MTCSSTTLLVRIVWWPSLWRKSILFRFFWKMYTIPRWHPNRYAPMIQRYFFVMLWYFLHGTPCLIYRPDFIICLQILMSMTTETSGLVIPEMYSLPPTPRAPTTKLVFREVSCRYSRVSLFFCILCDSPWPGQSIQTIPNKPSRHASFLPFVEEPQIMEVWLFWTMHWKHGRKATIFPPAIIKCIFPFWVFLLSQRELAIVVFFGCNANHFENKVKHMLPK